MRVRTAVAGFTVAGPKCNLPFHAELLEHPEFVSGHYRHRPGHPDASLTAAALSSLR
ncbi:MAG TPA: hypothetical protein VJT72_19920 [Pseudonocardiaceae bacterium]|nr:hypothetical protein [Pseudonocardiaceae bacterium]